MERDDSVLSKILLENIGIDFRFGNYLGMRHFLFEVHGYVPNIDDYLSCVCDAISQHTHELIKNGYVHFTFDESAFDRMQNKFFDTAMFDVTLVIGKAVYEECSYDQVSSGIVDGKRFIKIYISVSDTGLLDLLTAIHRSVSHELLHAYQDMSAIEKSGRRIYDTFDKERYGRMIRMYLGQDGSDRYIQELLLLLYHTEPIEANAFTAEIRADLQSNIDFINGSRKAEEVIKGTETYVRLSSCWDVLEGFKSITDNDDKSRIIQAYNEVFRTNVKSYNKVMKKLTARLERFSNQVMERASKIAYDIFAEKKPCILK